MESFEQTVSADNLSSSAQSPDTSSNLEPSGGRENLSTSQKVVCISLPLIYLNLSDKVYRNILWDKTDVLNIVCFSFILILFTHYWIILMKGYSFTLLNLFC